MAESYYRRSGATLVSWEPFVGGAPGRIWNYSFGLAGVSPELTRHFTLGSFAGGAVADLVVGAIWQGVEDELAYGLWSHNPGLAFRRSAAGAGANATVGLIGGGSTAIVLAIAVGISAPLPPTWGIAGITIGATVLADLTIGDWVEEKWFRWLAR